MTTMTVQGSTRGLRATGRFLVVLVCGLVMAAPLFYLLSASLMSASDIMAFPPHLVPPEIVWHNYVEAFNFLSPRVIANSVIFSVGIVVLQLLISLPAGFALAKIPFRWTAVVLGILIVPMFVPSNMTLIPTYLVVHQMQLVGTYAGMILPVAGQTAFAILLFRQSFLSLPDGLIEAARLDGASWLRVLVSVAVPLVKPALAAYCSISLLTAWNSYIWPQVIAPDADHKVMTVALAPLASGQYSLLSPSVGLAAAVISMAPVLIFFVVFQKWYVKGIAGTGVD